MSATASLVLIVLLSGLALVLLLLVLVSITDWLRWQPWALTARLRYRRSRA